MIRFLLYLLGSPMGTAISFGIVFGVITGTVFEESWTAGVVRGVVGGGGMGVFVGKIAAAPDGERDGTLLGIPVGMVAMEIIWGIAFGASGRDNLYAAIVSGDGHVIWTATAGWITRLAIGAIAGGIVGAGVGILVVGELQSGRTTFGEISGLVLGALFGALIPRAVLLFIGEGFAEELFISLLDYLNPVGTAKVVNRLPLWKVLPGPNWFTDAESFLALTGAMVGAIVAGVCESTKAWEAFKNNLGV